MSKVNMREAEWLALYNSLEKRSPEGKCTVAEKEPHMLLNRWHNVLPFDDHRIKLQGTSDDYINASLVMDDDTGHRYIATQGPLAKTTADFWTMVWQQKSSVVVMLCKTCENNIDKCHQYWPSKQEHEKSSTLKFPERNLDVRLLGEEHFEDFIKRRLLLTHKGKGSEGEKSREVFQLQFLSWPDFGVPRSPQCLLRFLRATREARGEVGLRDPPCVVHCSAGIGRSGTFCLVDVFSTKMERAREKAEAPTLPEVCETLLRLRRCRRGLVQTHQQLRYSYEAISLTAEQLCQEEADDIMENGGAAVEQVEAEAGNRKREQDAEEEEEQPDGVESAGQKRKRQRTESGDNKSG